MKTRNFKRFVSLVIAAAMIFALGVTAMAAEPTPSGEVLVYCDDGDFEERSVGHGQYVLHLDRNDSATLEVDVKHGYIEDYDLNWGYSNAAGEAELEVSYVRGTDKQQVVVKGLTGGENDLWVTLTAKDAGPYHGRITVVVDDSYLPITKEVIRNKEATQLYRNKYKVSYEALNWIRDKGDYYSFCYYSKNYDSSEFGYPVVDGFEVCYTLDGYYMPSFKEDLNRSIDLSFHTSMDRGERRFMDDIAKANDLRAFNKVPDWSKDTGDYHYVHFNQKGEFPVEVVVNFELSDYWVDNIARRDMLLYRIDADAKTVEYAGEVTLADNRSNWISLTIEEGGSYIITDYELAEGQYEGSRPSHPSRPDRPSKPEVKPEKPSKPETKPSRPDSGKDPIPGTGEVNTAAAALAIAAAAGCGIVAFRKYSR